MKIYKNFIYVQGQVSKQGREANDSNIQRGSPRNMAERIGERNEESPVDKERHT